MYSRNGKYAVCFCLAFLFISSAPLFALYNRYGIPDSSEIRKDLIETWFEAPLSSVRMNRPEIRENSVGQKFQIRLEESEDSFNIFVAPYARIEVDIYSDKGRSTELQDVFPGDGAGSWLLVRDKKTGAPSSIRYYFAADSEVFVQFTPASKTAFADFIIYGLYASRGVPTGLSFSRFYTASFEEIVKWTSGMLPWQYTRIHTDGYHASLQMIYYIRQKQSSILYTEDAMYDENGESVYISTGEARPVQPEEKNKLILSGAGFLKWIADGIIEPLTGGKSKREPLLMQTVSYKDTGFQGVLSQKYNLSFSLDWVRNLATAIYSVRTGRNYLYNESGVDVTVEPFAAEITSQGIRNLSGFIKDSGYPATALMPLLYVLAATEPETFYFAAIRETDRRSPEVKVFNECAAIFPYFDGRGHFKCAVFKDGLEIPFDEFYSRYCKEYVFLTRARCTEQFFPD
ncbi:MAG: hypothetical protein ACFNKL_03550 [Treponema sp.]